MFTLKALLPQDEEEFAKIILYPSVPFTAAQGVWPVPTEKYQQFVPTCRC